MATIAQEVVIGVPVETFYDLVVDYGRYPEFVPGIKACRVRATTPEKLVEYELDVGLRRITYVLRHEEARGVVADGHLGEHRLDELMVRDRRRSPDVPC